LDTQTGQEIWRKEERGDRVDPFTVLVAVAEGGVYVPGTGLSSEAAGCPTGIEGAPVPACVLASGEKAAIDVLDDYDSRSGASRWRAGGAHLPVSVVAAGGLAVLMSSGDTQQVIAFDSATGSRSWEQEVPHAGQAVATTTIAGGVVYVATWGRVPNAGD
jgi:outer membrane protein assembly factor BamB